MTTGSNRVGTLSTNYPESAASKNRFQYLFFDLSRGYLNALASSHCDCASLAAKIFVLALPILCFFEAIVDLACVPFIWVANQLCRIPPIPPLVIPPPSALLPANPNPPLQTEVLAPPPEPPPPMAQVVPIVATPEPVVVVAPQQPPQPLVQAQPPIAAAPPQVAPQQEIVVFATPEKKSIGQKISEYANTFKNSIMFWRR